jgi:hypothetical protein
MPQIARRLREAESVKPLTGPERSAEWRNVPGIRSEIHRRGGCGCCSLRDRQKDTWDRGFCTVPQRVFPKCLSDGRQPEFELDELTVSHLTRREAA